MSLDTVVSLISTVGFPICCCIALFYYMTKQREEHKEEVEKMTEALNNNTIALKKLEIKLGVDED